MSTINVLNYCWQWVSNVYNTNGLSAAIVVDIDACAVARLMYSYPMPLCVKATLIWDIEWKYIPRFNPIWAIRISILQSHFRYGTARLSASHILRNNRTLNVHLLFILKCSCIRNEIFTYKPSGIQVPPIFLVYLFIYTNYNNIATWQNQVVYHVRLETCAWGV